MEDITIKSEFSDEMQINESSLNYDSSENPEIKIKDENYDETDEYEMEHQREIMDHLNAAGIQMEAQNNIQQYNSAGDDGSETANSYSGGSKNLIKLSKVRDGSNVRFEFTAGYRRNSVLIYLVDEKQLFTKKYSHNHMDRYTCYTKSCKASLLFDTYLNKIVKLYHTFHLHPDQSDVYKKMKVLNEMKDYCLTNDGSNLTTKQIFDRKCDVMKEAAHLVEYNKIKRNLNRLKKSAMQKPISNCSSFEDMMHGMNDFADDRNNSASKWDTKDRIPPARVPSPPVSSDGDSKEASNAAPSAPSAPNFTVQIPAKKSQTQPPPFKKIKLTHQEHDAPFTEGYLEDAVPSFQLKTSNIRKSPPPRPNPRIYQDEGSHICSSCPCVAAQENEYDKIGKAWASELKLMSKEQQIFAKRAIAEIIFEGQLGGLSRHSVLIRQDNPTNEGEPFVIHENAEFLFEKSSQHSTGV
ncbi:uncharacterized protein LOC129952582 isoform X1 [Eupeodes corollae]|uniref:uncharacterized protein LOC129952582 isoform X1 n=1 Tax=Eupeodes corollae TaxID=290404 RepID=UPI002490B35C|nr:uncharacterized protein LOC129952582 isoform X1 [Eupeodes corollae]